MSSFSSNGVRLSLVNSGPATLLSSSNSSSVDSSMTADWLVVATRRPHHHTLASHQEIYTTWLATRQYLAPYQQLIRLSLSSGGHRHLHQLVNS